jgi:hypothetical protein
MLPGFGRLSADESACWIGVFREVPGQPGGGNRLHMFYPTSFCHLFAFICEIKLTISFPGIWEVAMRTKQGPVIHQGEFVASLEQHRLWRYTIKRVKNGEVLLDGWTGELGDAIESADRQLSHLCGPDAALPKAS